MMKRFGSQRDHPSCATAIAVEAEDKAIRYSANGWSFSKTPNGHAVSRSEGSFLTFQFTGTKLSWIGSIASQYLAVATYTIDGLVTIPFPDAIPLPILTPNHSSSSDSAHSPTTYTLFETPSLSPGPHNITVVNQRNGSNLALGYLVVHNSCGAVQVPPLSTLDCEDNPSGPVSQTMARVMDQKPLYRRSPDASSSPSSSSATSLSQDSISTTAVLAGVFGSFGFFIFVGCIFLFVRRRYLRKASGAAKRGEGKGGLQPPGMKGPEQGLTKLSIPPAAYLPSLESAVSSDRQIVSHGVESYSPLPSPPLSPSPRRYTTQRTDRRYEIANKSKNSNAPVSPKRGPPQHLASHKEAEKVARQPTKDTGHRRPKDPQQGHQELKLQPTTSKGLGEGRPSLQKGSRPSKESLNSPLSPRRSPRGAAQSDDQEDGGGRPGTPVPSHPPLKFSHEPAPAVGAGRNRQPRRLASEEAAAASGQLGLAIPGPDNDDFLDASVNIANSRGAAAPARQTAVSILSASALSHHESLQAASLLSSGSIGSRPPQQQQLVLDLPPAYTPE